MTEILKKGVVRAYDHTWDLIETKQLVRRIILVWFLGLVCYATIQVFNNMEKVNAPVATVYGTLLALNGMLFGFYFHSRKDERSKE